MSRADWEKCLDDWTNLALQVKEEKTFPWPGASNVKYPLLSTAAMQFNARAYPSLVPSTGDLVKCMTIGYDKEGYKTEQAGRVAKFMSYQILNKMTGWEEDMDRMLMQLPVVGTMFKKTYYDKSEDKIKSCLILPENIVVNYWTTSLKDCERISEVILMSKRVLKERQAQKIFLEEDLGDPVAPENADDNATNDVS